MEFEYEYKKYRKLNFNSRFKEKEYDKRFYKLLNEYISRLSYELSFSSEQIDELVDRILENVDVINYTDDLDMYVLGDFNATEKSINLNKKLLNPNSKYSLFFTLCRELTHAQGYDEKTNSFGMYKSNQNEIDYEGTGLDELITEMISTLVTTDTTYLLDEAKTVAISSVYSQLLFVGEVIASILGVSKKYLLKVAYNKREVFDEVMSNRFLTNQIYEKFILEISLCVSTLKNILEDIDLNVQDRNKNLIVAFENLCNIANMFLVERSKKDINDDPYQDLGDYIESMQFDYINVLYNIKLAAHSFGISFKDLKINKFLQDDYIDRVNYLLTLFSYEQTKNVYEFNISNYYSDEFTGGKLKEIANEKFGMEYVGKKLPIELELDMQDMEEIVIPEKIKIYKDPYLDSYILRSFYDKNISDIAKSKFSERFNENTEKIKNMYYSLKERFGFRDSEEVMALPEHIEDEEVEEDLEENDINMEEIPYDITSYINLIEEAPSEEKNSDISSESKEDMDKTMIVPTLNLKVSEEESKNISDTQEEIKYSSIDDKKDENEEIETNIDENEEKKDEINAEDIIEEENDEINEILEKLENKQNEEENKELPSEDIDEDASFSDERPKTRRKRKGAM